MNEKMWVLYVEDNETITILGIYKTKEKAILDKYEAEDYAYRQGVTNCKYYIKEKEVI